MGNEYVELVETCGSMLIVAATGFIAAWVGLIPKKHIGIINSYVFHVALPCLVFRALAVQDLSSLNWEFVLVFLYVRIAMAVLSAGFTWILKGDIGDFLTHYIASTWMSTIIYGVPILQALYPDQNPVILPLLASLSSLFAQLPFMLAMYDIHHYSKLEKGGEFQEHHVRGQPLPTIDPIAEAHHKTHEEEAMVCGTDSKPTSESSDSHQHEERSPVFQLPEQKPSIWIRAWTVLKHTAMNMPLWGIVLGLIWSGIGWDIPDVLDDSLEMLGQTVTPVALFSVGTFCYHNPVVEQHKPKSIGLISGYLISKFFIVPLLAWGFLEAQNITGEDAESGVIIAALPISAAAFALAKRYDVRENEISATIVLGIILMTPALFWIQGLIDTGAVG
eukprot:Clim_evm29s3 gene=Clim_evmTU29s3